MLKFSFKVVYMIFMVIGVMMVLSSNHWLGAWFGLEVGLLSFIPLILSTKSSFKEEASMKYFLVQAMASFVFIASGLVSLSSGGWKVLVGLGLVMKMGVAPLHFWFPQVVEGLDWSEMLILMTIQKISPLVLLFWLEVESEFMSITGMLSAIVGAWGGINELSVKKMLAFSSISHFGWIFSAGLSSLNLSFTYFGFYSLLLMSVVMVALVFNMKSVKIASMPVKISSLFMVFMMSLGGMPPLMGFFPKVLVLSSLMHLGLFTVIFVLLVSSLISLFYYCRLAFAIILKSEDCLKIFLIKEDMSVWVMLSFLGSMVFSLIVFIMS